LSRADAQDFVRSGRLFVWTRNRQEAQLSSRVLIADPDAALRQRLYAGLLNIDVFSDCVGSTADALARLDELSYSLVIVDIDLPGGGAERLVSRIAKIDPAKRPIVLVSAGTADAARSLDVEIVQIVLRRPVNSAQLIDLISSCVRSSLAPRRERDAKARDAESRDRAI
jgi:two-component system, NtrC family, response regulator PilR